MKIVPELFMCLNNVCLSSYFCLAKKLVLFEEVLAWLTFVLLFLKVVHQFTFHFLLHPLVSQTADYKLILKPKQLHFEQGRVGRVPGKSKAIPIGVSKSASKKCAYF